ncbi:MAG: ATP-binding protein [Candidatus Omnitrophica bacterium]|nr:ATP-binding protein [Candidatus Omnitrophota bacterium]
MDNPEFWLNILRLGNLLLLLGLGVFLMLTLEKNKQQKITIDKLAKSLEEMDEQAKLIVRTDMELNKAQEELDKKVIGLYALQRLSRTMSTSLEEMQIFKKISPSYLEELGFEKAAGFLWNDKENDFIIQLNIGYLEDEIGKIRTAVNLEKDLYLDLIKEEKAVSSTSIQQYSGLNKESIIHFFKVNSFVISPILPKEGSRGFLFVGKEDTGEVPTEGDEELITVLANQIGQAIENARLFEKSWKTQLELEKKVEERTRELTNVLEEVQKISNRKTDFISSVSHELRTPLTSIKGYAAILIAEKLGALPPAVKERLEKINHHSDELVHMVNDLLDIARIEAGRATMKIELQDLQSIIATVSDLIMIQCKNKNIELVTNIEADMPLIPTDRGQIERVFINLLGNAVKFTPQNGKITINAELKDGVVQVGISDTGIGIPEEAISKLFTEFYRIDNAINQQVKGTGLGLSLVKHIIEAHKGNIWVESTLGKGSTFFFTLPID